jgi:hypothetical protein
MAKKVLDLEIYHPDPHQNLVKSFRIKVSNDAAGPFTQIGPDVTFDRNAVTVGEAVVGVKTQVTIDVPPDPINFYFVCCAVNDDNEESVVSTKALISVSYKETFLPPSIVIV